MPSQVIPVSVSNKSNDVLDKNGPLRADSEHLNKLAAAVTQAPTSNPFSDYVQPHPKNSDLSTYVLPEYLDIFVAHLVIRMNKTPSNLPQCLYPYIQLDPTLNVLIAHEPSLNLLTLQRLDYLLGKDRDPTPLDGIVSKLSKAVRRNKSKYP